VRSTDYAGLLLNSPCIVARSVAGTNAARQAANLGLDIKNVPPREAPGEADCRGGKGAACLADAYSRYDFPYADEKAKRA
jgi:hypothetical protein